MKKYFFSERDRIRIDNINRKYSNIVPRILNVIMILYVVFLIVGAISYATYKNAAEYHYRFNTIDNGYGYGLVDKALIAKELENYLHDPGLLINGVRYHKKLKYKSFPDSISSTVIKREYYRISDSINKSHKYTIMSPDERDMLSLIKDKEIYLIPFLFRFTTRSWFKFPDVYDCVKNRSDRYKRKNDSIDAKNEALKQSLKYNKIKAFEELHNNWQCN